MRRRWKLAIGLLAACVGVWAVDAWRLRATWRQARGEVAAGKFATALPRLVGLAGRWPTDGEVLYHLGSCELALGRREQAAEAFSRVPRNSPFAGRAAVMRARQALQNHRLAVAEELMPLALQDEGPHAVEARETLIHLFKLQGRYDEARRLVREGWTRYPDRVGTLQELARLDTATPIKIEKVRPTLETAYRAAPDDDRIWLGWANLAIRTGRFEEARKWLNACHRRRPEDPAAWRVHLNCAQAAEDTIEARKALTHLSPDQLPPDQVLALQAWFERRAGDLDGDANPSRRSWRATGGRLGHGAARRTAPPIRPHRRGGAGARPQGRAHPDPGLVRVPHLPERPTRSGASWPGLRRR